MSHPWRVEFHCHSRYSPDSLSSARGLIDAARERGVDRLVITDHNTIRGALAAKALDPERIIVGEEILTQRGELLAAFVSEEVPAMLDPQEAIQRLRQQGAFISVSHPFDRARSGWEIQDLAAIAPQVDAIEVFNARCLHPSLNEQAAAFAQEHRLAGTVGSDAHTLAELGGATLWLPPFANADELRQAIRSGQAEARLSPFWVHLSSTYARFYKMVFRNEETS